jgi:hypothetical protein
MQNITFDFLCVCDNYSPNYSHRQNILQRWQNGCIYALEGQASYKGYQKSVLVVQGYPKESFDVVKKKSKGPLHGKKFENTVLHKGN